MKFAAPIRWLIVLGFFPFFAFSQEPLIFYKLQLLPDGQTWGVYMKPDASLPTNQFFVTGSAQVTVVMPLNYQWSEFTTVSGQWSPNSIVQGPIENPTKTYVSFGLVTTAVFPIAIVPGQETLLFKFKQTNDCPDALYLFDNITDVFNPPNSTSTNPGNDFSAWGSISGNLNYGGNYAPAAWDCHDSDGDGILNAHEDTNGNGIYDPGIDASNLYISDAYELEQVLDLKLQLLPDGQSWGVYVKPDDSVFPSLLTQVAAGQVTIVMPLGYEWSQLISVGGVWSADGRIDGPNENPAKTYQSFGWVTEFPHIDIINGQETLLFTFKGDGSCPEELYLLNNYDDPFLPPNSQNANMGNDLVVFDPLGDVYEYRGNYGTFAWSCHDSDSDGLLNAFEDTNGNGVYDSTDASDLNGYDHPGCVKLRLKRLPGINTWAVVTKAFDGLVPTGTANLNAGRVTLVAPKDFEFEGFESMAGNWALTFTAVSPTNNPSRKYLSFELAESIATIPLSAANETTLFQFDWSGECLDSFYIMEDNMPIGFQLNEIRATAQTSQGQRSVELCGVYARRTWRCNNTPSWGTPVPGVPIVGVPDDSSLDLQPDDTEKSYDGGTQTAFFAASPNPAGDYVNINLDKTFAEGNCTIALWDLQGKKRSETKLENNTYLRLGLTDLPSGAYFITLANNGHVLQRSKLIKG